MMMLPLDDPRFVAMFFIVIFGLTVVEVLFKGYALWRAAKLNQLPWFIAILIVNSAGILPIIYLLLTKEEYSKLQAETSHPH